MIGQIYKSRCKHITQMVDKTNKIKDTANTKDTGKCILSSIKGKDSVQTKYLSWRNLEYTLGSHRNCIQITFIAKCYTILSNWS